MDLQQTAISRKASGGFHFLSLCLGLTLLLGSAAPSGAQHKLTAGKNVAPAQKLDFE